MSSEVNMRTYFAVLNVGGTKLSLDVLCKRTHKVWSRATIEYNGVLDGEFVDRAEFVNVLEDLLVEASTFDMNVKELVVVVPHVFSYCVTKNIETNFPSSRRLSQEALVQAKDFHDTMQLRIVHSTDLYHVLDENKVVGDVKGYVAKNVRTKHSVILADTEFIHVVQSSIGNQFNEVRFVSRPYVDAMYLLNDDVRDSTGTLVHFSMFDTAVSVVSGDGISHLVTIPIGFAHVINDLCIVKEIDHNVASVLCGLACLCVECNCDEVYEVRVGEEIRAFYKQEINEIIKCRVEELAEEVLSEISLFDDKLLKSNHPVYIYGGYTDIIKGAKAVITEVLGTNVHIANDPLTKVPAGEGAVLAAVKRFLE